MTAPWSMVQVQEMLTSAEYCSDGVMLVERVVFHQIRVLLCCDWAASL